MVVYTQNVAAFRTARDTIRGKPLQSVEGEEAKAVEKEDANSDDILIERQMMKKRRSNKKEQRSYEVISATRDQVYGGGPMSEAQKFENSIISILSLLFLAILLEGIFLGASGFMSEAMDQFAQDVVYPMFSPTLGVFLAGSSAYGLWKTRSAPNEKKD